MNNLKHLAYLVATDSTFRQALKIDPQAAIASQGLDLSAEELSALSSLRRLLAIPPQKLAGSLLSLNETLWANVTGEANLFVSTGQARALCK